MGFFSGFWATGSYAGEKLTGDDKTNLSNMQKVISPVSFLLLFIAVICSILYIIYASLFADKLNNDDNIEKIFNKSPALAALEAAQLDMIRYFENYRMVGDAAVISLLLIIALCCIYLVLKIK
jgi:amino acid transporter